jgi:signal transduction histidine kinase
MTPVDASLQEIRVLYCTTRDDLWIGTADNRLHVLHQGALHDLTQEAGFTGRRPIAIAEDAGGTVWVATIDELLLGFADGRFQHRYTSAQIPGGGHVQAMLVDAYDSLWLGTTQGLVLKQGEHFSLLTENDGLPDKMIYQLLEDARGRLWIGSRRGVYAVSLKELHAVAAGAQKRLNVTTLGKDEGLPSASASDGTQPNAWRARDGRLWFTTHAGLVGIDPDATLPVRPPPRLYIDQVSVDQQLVPAGSRLVVPAGRHQVEVRVDALDFSSPEKVRVLYQLVGYDPDWIDTASDRTINYSRLPPGRYTLRVIAMNQDGRRSEQATSLDVLVIPAWWQTWWAQAGGILAFTGVVVWLVRLRSHRRLRRQLRDLEHKHALEQERARIARDLHDELGGSVTQLGLQAERLKRQPGARELQPALDQLTWHTRRLADDVESIVWTVSPRNDSWRRLTDYISQFARRFFRDPGLDCIVEGADEIPDLPITPEAQHHVLAAAKEAMNNIVKHARARRVTLCFRTTDGAFELILRDDGIGFDPTAPEHAERNGLTNMRTRFQELGGECLITSAPGAGAEVRLRVPFAIKPTGSAPA